VAPFWVQISPSTSIHDEPLVSLVELAIDDLRCVEHAELELHPGLNLIWGGNGSGKTSLLEGIFLLGRGRSFRTRNSERLIRYGQSRLVVFGRTGRRSAGPDEVGLGSRAGAGSGGFRLDGQRPAGAGSDALGSSGLERAALRSGAFDPDGSGRDNPGVDRVAPDALEGSGFGVEDGSGSRGYRNEGFGRSSGAVRDDAEAGGVAAEDLAGGEAPKAGGAGGCHSFGPSGTDLEDSGALASRDPKGAQVAGVWQPGLERESEGRARTQARRGGAIQSSERGFAGRESSGQALGVQVSRVEGTTARISGANAKSLTELTEVFPVQVIDPGIHKLVEEGGHRRRRWMDWAVFHVEHQFGGWWLRYTRALKQRNAALRTHPAQAEVWDSELIRLGELIAAARGRFVEGLLPYWRECVLALSGLEPELYYFKGWAQDTTLAEALAASRARDESKCTTHPGPHRADVIVRMKGRPAREVLSRGQQKLVAVAMTLAQLHLVKAATRTTPTLLLDDPAAELDDHHLRRFIDQVLRLESQLILTSLQPGSQLFGTPDRVFHVEQGRVKPA
jgi:DNA replication and repair protein RecF